MQQLFEMEIEMAQRREATDRRARQVARRADSRAEAAGCGDPKISWLRTAFGALVGYRRQPRLG
ncbi:MAG TPA: hypothetical protein VF134_02630 [Candidatus Dormibacteraeota bacterium]